MNSSITAFTKYVIQYAIHNVKSNTDSYKIAHMDQYAQFTVEKKLTPSVDMRTIAFEYGKEKTTTDISVGRPET